RDDRGDAHGRARRGHQDRPRAAAARLVDPRDRDGPHGRRSEAIGRRSLLPPARREERLSRRCEPVRLRRHAAYDVVDSGDGLAHHGFSERADANGRRVKSTRSIVALALATGVWPGSPAAQGPSSPRYSSNIMTFDLRSGSATRVLHADGVWEAPNW